MASFKHVVLGSIIVFLGLLSLITPSYAANAQINVVAAPTSFYNNGVRLCAVDNDGNCHWEKYGKSLIAFGAPGIVLAALCFLFVLVFLPIRACGGFGGNEPSEGVFCPGSDALSRQYSRKEVLSVKVIACLCIIPVIIGVAIGIGANQAVGHSVSDVTGFMLDTANNVTFELQGVKNELLSMEFTEDAIAPLNQILNESVKITQKMADIKTGGDKYDGYRTSIMYAGFAVSLFVLVTGVVAIGFNFKKLGMVTGTMTFVVLVLVWLSFGFHLLSNKLDYDVCYEADLINHNATNQTSVLQSGPLASLWDCGPNSTYAQLRNIVEDAIQEGVNATCSGRDEACKSPLGWVCLQNLTCTEENLKTIIQKPYTIVEGQYSIPECAQQCSVSQNRQASGNITLGVATLANYTNIYNNDIKPLLDCNMVRDTVNNFQPLLCGSFFSNLYNISVASFIVGLFLIPYGILMIIGTKRFIPLHDATA
eukprot:TRINITY_DN20264_c0_g1_i1.p1 TRINITY_DN20264_c0_g1~~TRINITY_DN20264_c0_g1_i1.p1  ORF type:complete len:480 (+),score=112.81 TRINITY_DN20264_c0_g1_i1:59-1498(+)